MFSLQQITSKKLYLLVQGCSHFFSMRANYKMNKSKLSTYYKMQNIYLLKKYIKNYFYNVCWCTLHTHTNPHCTTHLTM